MRLFRSVAACFRPGANPDAAGCIILTKLRSFFACLLAVFLIALPPAALADEVQKSADLRMDCGACLLSDLDSGTVLYGQNNDKQIFPASVTKVLTALVVLRHIEEGDIGLYEEVTVSDTFQEGLTAQAASANLSTGERVDVEQLLFMLLLPSACDAANVLAEAVDGSVSAFAEDMNETARELGCTGSHFVNPSGLHDENHYTTCDDLFLIGKAAYQYEEFRAIIGSKSHTVPATNMSGERLFHNTNALISSHNHTEYLYPPCKGGKTGSTNPAKFNLLSFAEQDGLRLCCVMMNCDWRYDSNRNKIWPQYYESKRLYEWGYDNFERKTLVKKGSEQGSVRVSKARSGKDATVAVKARKSIKAVVPKGTKKKELHYSVQLPDSVIAPVQAGDKLGTLTVSYAGEKLGSTDLLAAEDVEAKSSILPRLNEIPHTPRPLAPWKIVLGIFALIFGFFGVQALRRRAWRRRKRRERERARRKKRRDEFYDHFQQ